MDKRIKATIRETLKMRPEITTDEAIEIVKVYAEKPDPVKLEEQYYRRVANSILASFRDDTNVRECFNVKTMDGKSVYVNVSETQNLKQLEAAKLALASKYRGLNRSLQKVQSREKELSNQLVIDFMQADNQ